MKIKALLFLCLFLPALAGTQTPAWDRIATFGEGMNLSWLENYWDGTAVNNYSDYLNMNNLAARKADLSLMAEMGVESLRLPICFDVWEDGKSPYSIDRMDYFEAVDSMQEWTEALGLNLIIDFHHGSLFECGYAQEKERVKALWLQIANRYKDTDPERVFFELYNEPYDLSAEAWRAAAGELISILRPIIPHHTLIVGGVNFNGIDGLWQMEPFADPNIIYTFHFYEPFIFTHQGAPWMGSATVTTGIPFPYRQPEMPEVSPGALDTWGAFHLEQYAIEGQEAYLRFMLEAAKDWSIEYDRPIWCGEWGSYYDIDQEDRCRHAAALVKTFKQLDIPHCYWEWDRNFRFFEGSPDLDQLPNCMKEVWEIENPTTSHVFEDDETLLFNNPFQEELRIHLSPDSPFDELEIHAFNGKYLGRFVIGSSYLSFPTRSWPDGLYLFTFRQRNTGHVVLKKAWKTVH